MILSFSSSIKTSSSAICLFYNRYHMQAQYGRDVFGSVRLKKARVHWERANDILSSITIRTAEEDKKSIRRQTSEESNFTPDSSLASETLLRNGDSLSDKKTSSL